MRTIQEIHELYELYTDNCEVEGSIAHDYDQWLELMLIQSDIENQMLEDEIGCHRHAAEVNHCMYVQERNGREAIEASMLTVGFMLQRGLVDDARRLAVHVGIFN